MTMYLAIIICIKINRVHILSSSYVIYAYGERKMGKRIQPMGWLNIQCQIQTHIIWYSVRVPV